MSKCEVYLLLTLFSSVLCIVFVDADDFVTIEGSPCDTDSSTGVCLRVAECIAAKEQIRRTRRHNFPRCGFSGFDEIVCCPDSESTTKKPDVTTVSPTSKTLVRGPVVSRSALACDEYSNEVPAKVEYQILDGEDAKLGEFPHMAGLGYQDDNSDEINFECGGSLISNLYVLSAAHCIMRRGSANVTRIRLGKIDILNNTDGVPAQDYGVSQIIIHPKYHTQTKANDIALIKLSTPVTTTEYVHPACLYHKSDDPHSVVITGWGLTSVAGDGSQILQKATLSTVSVADCNRTHNSAVVPRSILPTQICAKSENGSSDACQGDSGGPMQVQIKSLSSIYSIVGITSFGRGCGGTFPGVYTRVHSYLDWIERIVWPQ